MIESSLSGSALDYTYVVVTMPWCRPHAKALCVAVVVSTTAVEDFIAGAVTPKALLLVIADDLGWNNVGWHGNTEVQTPTLDRLVRAGIELDRMYAYKYCSPTRSSILSGRLPYHVNEQNRAIWQAGGGVDLRMDILPAKLQRAGFTTHQLGKWHACVGDATTAPVRLRRTKLTLQLCAPYELTGGCRPWHTCRLRAGSTRLSATWAAPKTTGPSVLSPLNASLNHQQVLYWHPVQF